MTSEVTILLPFYNPGQHIIRTLNSVLRQKNKNWKMVLIDDASTSTPPEIDRYLSDPRVTFIRNSNNLGKSKSLNIGLKMAETPYVLTLDANSWLSPKAVQILMTEATDQPYDVAVVYGNTVIHVKNSQGKKVETRIQHGKIFTDRYEVLLAIHSLKPHLLRTQALKKIGGWPINDPYQGRYLGDQRVLLRLIERYRFHWVDQPLYHLRQYNQNSKKDLQIYSELIEWMVRHALKRWGDQYEPFFMIDKDGRKKVVDLDPKSPSLSNKKNRTDQATLLNTDQVMRKIETAIKTKRPLSIARVGDGENILLAQYVVLKEKKFMKTSAPKQVLLYGVKLPDKAIRDELAAALRKVDLIGILPYSDSRIKVKPEYKRQLTNKVFDHYRITPKFTFDAYLFRYLISDRRFWKLFKNKRIVVISKWAKEFRKICKPLSKRWNIEFVKAVPMENYRDVPKVVKKLKKVNFDIALITAGVTSLVLCQQIAEQYGKVTIDIGKGMAHVTKGKTSLPISTKTTDTSTTISKHSFSKDSDLYNL